MSGWRPTSSSRNLKTSLDLKNRSSLTHHLISSGLQDPAETVLSSSWQLQRHGRLLRLHLLSNEATSTTLYSSQHLHSVHLRNGVQLGFMGSWLVPPELTWTQHGTRGQSQFCPWCSVQRCLSWTHRKVGGEGWI